MKENLFFDEKVLFFGLNCDIISADVDFGGILNWIRKKEETSPAR